MSATRTTGPDAFPFAPPIQWNDHKTESHEVQFYSQDSSLLDELSRFIGTALGAGDVAIVVATKENRKGLDERLSARGLSLATAVEQGRYISLDAAATLAQFMVKDRPDPDLFTAVIGDVMDRASAVAGRSNRVVAFGEMVALLWTAGHPESAIQLEHLWTGLAETRSFSLRCAYPLKSFHLEEHREPFLRICASHTDVIPADSYTDLATEHERLSNIAQLQQKEQVHEALIRTKEALEQQIAENIETERKLRDSERSLRELSSHLLRMQDEERRHLGRELHDSVGQYLASLKMSLDLMRSESQSELTGQQLSDCLRLVEQSISEVRTMSYLLYPPMLEEMGLGTAIPWYLDGFAKRSGIQTGSDIPATLGRLPRDVELAIFRVIQESLANVLRHSESATAHILLSIEGDTARVEIKDQGKGIPAAILKSASNAVGTLGVGLRGMSESMRQLGGKLEMLSNESGTTIIATVPCGGCGLSEMSGRCENATEDSDRRRS